MNKEACKVCVFGAGNVGSTLGFILATKGLVDEVVLIDIAKDMAIGKALDISQSMPIYGTKTLVSGTDDFSAVKDAEIVVVTAGFPRKPGMSRDDLLYSNAKVMMDIGASIKVHAPNAIVIVVTNPLEIMTYVMLKTTGFSRQKVIGMGGILDSARMASFISEKLGAGDYDISTSVLGGHGDLMVPMKNAATISNQPLQNLLSEAQIDEIVERTKKGGAEIVGYLKTGSAYYTPAVAANVMCEAILTASNKVYPCSVFLEGEYGHQDTIGGVLVSLGANGVEKIVEFAMTDEEKALFAQTVGKTKELIDLFEQNREKIAQG